MSAQKPLQVKPVGEKTWPDFEKLFESKGAPGYCWCMAWRPMFGRKDQLSGDDRKQAIRALVKQKTPIGLLGYAGAEPVAWCSVAPRDTFRNLGGDDALENVWSVVCFFIKREYRRAGYTSLLIDNAKRYAKKHGARYLESYPVKPDSPSYRFMGFLSIFKKAGFSQVKKAGTRRHVMICEL